MSVSSQTLQLYWQHIRRRKKLFYGLSFTSSAAVVLDQFLPPLIVATAFNRLSNGQYHSGHFWHAFGGLIAVYVALLLMSLFLWRLTVWLTWNLEVEVKRELSARSFDFLINQSSTFHNNRFGGALVSQTTKFVNAFERLFDTYTFDIVTNITAFIATVLILLPRAPLYTAAFLGVSAPYFAFMYWRTKKQQPFNAREAHSESQQTAQLADVITNAQTVKMYGHEAFEATLFGRRTADVARRSYDLRNIDAFNRTIYNFFSNGLDALAFILGIYLVAEHHANVGLFYLILNYTFNLLERLWQFGQVMRNITRGLGDAHDMTEILHSNIDVTDTPNVQILHVRRGDVAFHNVTFAYPEQPDRVLFDKLDLHIKPGEKIGLVGPSGSGKTTITKLLLRFMDIQGGEILIDNQLITNVTQESLRTSIAYVPQEPLMFHRTIAENIRYGELDASSEAVEGAAKLANAHGFIKDLPNGYDTLVGERGTKLSGGQRQRVAIARAMLKNAPILVLDEATSALDSESEALIQDALWKLMEGRTAIVIAHRLSTIQHMDRIIVLDQGKIVEQGSHKELLRNPGGTYAKLWAHQSGGFIEE